MTDMRKHVLKILLWAYGAKSEWFFTGQDKLLSHLRTLHNQQGELFCENCHNLYKSPSDLEQHTKKRECFSQKYKSIAT